METHCTGRPPLTCIAGCYTTGCFMIERRLYSAPRPDAPQNRGATVNPRVLSAVRPLNRGVVNGVVEAELELFCSSCSAGFWEIGCMLFTAKKKKPDLPQGDNTRPRVLGASTSHHTQLNGS